MFLVALDMSKTQFSGMSSKILLKGILIITAANRNEHECECLLQHRPSKTLDWGKSPVSTML